MRRFKLPQHTQRFLEPFGPIREHFYPGHHLLSAAAYRATLRRRFVVWHEVTGTAASSSTGRPRDAAVNQAAASPSGFVNLTKPAPGVRDRDRPPMAHARATD